MKFKLTEKQIRTKQDAEKRVASLKMPLLITLGVLIAIICFFETIVTKAPMMVKILLPVALIDIVLLVVTFINANRASTSLACLKILKCSSCKQELSLDDLVEYKAGETKRVDYTSTTENVKKEFKDASVEELAARKYLGQEVTETHTSKGTYYEFSVYATFRCPKCGEIVTHDPKKKEVFSKEPTEEEKIQAVKKYYEKYYFVKYRTLLDK